MSLIERPLVHPDRKTSGMRPLKAWRHFRNLVADKEDTAQVFHIIEARKGRGAHEQAWDFIRSDEGQGILRSEVNIPAILDDHGRWADCGLETVAALNPSRFMKAM